MGETDVGNKAPSLFLSSLPLRWVQVHCDGHPTQGTLPPNVISLPGTSLLMSFFRVFLYKLISNPALPQEGWHVWGSSPCHVSFPDPRRQPELPKKWKAVGKGSKGASPGSAVQTALVTGQSLRTGLVD